MKDLLNFIPSKQKKILARVFIIKVANKILIWLFIITTIFTITLYGSQLLMKNEVTILQQEQNNTRVLINDDENITIESAISDLNKTTTRLSNVQTEYVNWTVVMKNLESIVVDGVYLENISINSDALTASLQGIAETRDAYFKFEAALNSSSLIESANLPLSLLKEDIPFRIQLVIEKDIFSTINETQ